MVVVLKTVSLLVQAKMDFAFLTVDTGEAGFVSAVFASLSGFPCWEMIKAILSHIRGHARRKKNIVLMIERPKKLMYYI